MSKADELLRRLFNEAFMAETIEECRAYLNEKPHEPTPTMPMYPSGYAEQLRPASPPHAASEPEKPMDTDQVNAAYAAYFNAHPPAAEPEKPMDDDLPGMLAVAKGVAEQKWPHTMDAAIWAREWIARTKDHPDVATDEGAMIGWFANAIMAGYDTAQSRASPSAQPIAREPRVQITAEIADERERQVSVEDWSPEHDDEHDEGVLAAAAASYALSGAAYSANPAWKIEYTKHARAVWPFDDEFTKPKDARRDLIRAGALIVAEIERLDRAALKRAKP